MQAFYATDLAVVGIILFSGVWAFFRGLVLEVLGVAAWVGAAFAALHLLPVIQPYARQLVGQDQIADIGGGIVIFLLVLVLLSILSSSLSAQVRQSALSALDRSLGFLFGLARGAAIVCLAYFAMMQLLKAPDHPAWLAEARTLPLLQGGATAIQNLIPAKLLEGSVKPVEQLDAAKLKAQQALEAERALRALTQPQPKPVETLTPGAGAAVPVPAPTAPTPAPAPASAPPAKPSPSDSQQQQLNDLIKRTQ